MISIISPFMFNDVGNVVGGAAGQNGYWQPFYRSSSFQQFCNGFFYGAKNRRWQLQ